MKEIGCLLIVLAILLLAATYDDIRSRGGITVTVDGVTHTVSWSTAK